MSTGLTQKAGVLDVLDPLRWNQLSWRASSGSKDSPFSCLMIGVSGVALGVSALAFTQMRLRRVRKERALVLQMWSARTSVRSLREMAERGEALPKVAMVRGWLFARGPPIQSLASEVPTLARLLGKVEQPENLYVQLAAQVKSGRAPDLPEDVAEHLGGVDLDGIDAARAAQPSGGGGGGGKQGQDAQGGGLLVSEMLVTRTACEASATEEDGSLTGHSGDTTKRSKRSVRFNVFHEQRVAEGLHLVGLAGEAADVVVPAFGIDALASGKSPPLFLSAPDAMAELTKAHGGVGLSLDSPKGHLTLSRKYGSPVNKMPFFSNADKPFLHMSKFLRLDQQSHTDDGGFNGEGFGFNGEGGGRALHELGSSRPEGWLWNGRGYYDNNPTAQSWMSHHGKEVLEFPAFAQRLLTARFAERTANRQPGGQIFLRFVRVPTRTPRPMRARMGRTCGEAKRSRPVCPA